MEKKTKLTISGSAKKSIKNIEIAKSQGKNSVVIEKQTGKFSSRGGSFRPGTNKPKPSSSYNRGATLKPSFNSKSFVIGGDLTLNEGFNDAPLLKAEFILGLFVLDLNDPPLLENFPVCFSITTEFFP